jgi:hypothetical protein
MDQEVFQANMSRALRASTGAEALQPALQDPEARVDLSLAPGLDLLPFEAPRATDDGSNSSQDFPTPISKITRAKWIGVMTQVVGSLLCKP